ncbi:ATP-binding protein [Sphaerisporangium sp. NPDC088356]|uniref:ATP-binding protein n=1 Tax=Sphaerisporangium sp. NPDC088356 TaxID=3154871 RepID=UPI0034461A48
MAGVRTRAQYLEIPARPEAAFYARKHVRRVLVEWRLEALLDTAELIASELVANAVKAMAGGGASDGREAPCDAPEHIWIDVYRAADVVVLEVWDAGRTPPVPRAAAPDDEGGRGLRLVDALAENWGYRRPVTGGKVVWCTLRVPV